MKDLYTNFVNIKISIERLNNSNMKYFWCCKKKEGYRNSSCLSFQVRAVLHQNRQANYLQMKPITSKWSMHVYEYMNSRKLDEDGE